MKRDLTYSILDIMWMCAISCCIGGIVSTAVLHELWKKAAIRHGAAQYTYDGKWQWNMPEKSR